MNLNLNQRDELLAKDHAILKHHQLCLQRKERVQYSFAQKIARFFFGSSESSPSKTSLLLGVKKIEGKEQLVLIDTKDLHCVNIFKKMLHLGPLKNVDYRIHQVGKYLNSHFQQEFVENLALRKIVKQIAVKADKKGYHLLKQSYDQQKAGSMRIKHRQILKKFPDNEREEILELLKLIEARNLSIPDNNPKIADFFQSLKEIPAGQRLDSFPFDGFENFVKNIQIEKFQRCYSSDCIEFYKYPLHDLHPELSSRLIYLQSIKKDPSHLFFAKVLVPSLSLSKELQVQIKDLSFLHLSNYQLFLEALLPLPLEQQKTFMTCYQSFSVKDHHYFIGEDRVSSESYWNKCIETMRQFSQKELELISSKADSLTNINSEFNKYYEFLTFYKTLSEENQVSFLDFFIANSSHPVFYHFPLFCDFFTILLPIEDVTQASKVMEFARIIERAPSLRELLLTHSFDEKIKKIHIILSVFSKHKIKDDIIDFSKHILENHDLSSSLLEKMIKIFKNVYVLNSDLILNATSLLKRHSLEKIVEDAEAALELSKSARCTYFIRILEKIIEMPKSGKAEIIELIKRSSSSDSHHIDRRFSQFSKLCQDYPVDSILKCASVLVKTTIYDTFEYFEELRQLSEDALNDLSQLLSFTTEVGKILPFFSRLEEGERAETVAIIQQSLSGKIKSEMFADMFFVFLKEFLLFSLEERKQIAQILGRMIQKEWHPCEIRDFLRKIRGISSGVSLEALTALTEKIEDFFQDNNVTSAMVEDIGSMLLKLSQMDNEEERDYLAQLLIIFKKSRYASHRVDRKTPKDRFNHHWILEVGKNILPENREMVIEGLRVLKEHFDPNLLLKIFFDLSNLQPEDQKKVLSEIVIDEWKIFIPITFQIKPGIKSWYEFECEYVYHWKKRPSLLLDFCQLYRMKGIYKEDLKEIYSKIASYYQPDLVPYYMSSAKEEWDALNRSLNFSLRLWTSVPLSVLAQNFEHFSENDKERLRLLLISDDGRLSSSFIWPIAEKFSSSFNKETQSDITLLIGDQTYFLHKAILACDKENFFRQQLEEGTLFSGDATEALIRIKTLYGKPLNRLEWSHPKSVEIVLEPVSFAKLLDTGTHSDCSVTVEGETFKTHRLILRQNSTFFEIALEKGFKEASGEIVLQQISPFFFEQMLRFFYTGQKEEEREEEFERTADYLMLK